MRERVYLCGLDQTQRVTYPDGTALSHDPETGNLTLRLERMRKRLSGNEPKRITDLIEIASYVFAADRNVSRGSLQDRSYSANWRRTFRMVVAVRDLEFWQRHDVKATLREALGFLSEDDWHFDFVPNLQPRPLQLYLGVKDVDVETSGGTSIVLFSGGLDSLAGAVHELLHTNRHVVLVSHRHLPGMGTRQQELAKGLAEKHMRRVTHVWVDNSLKAPLLDPEETQRTRSFFFASMAAVAAHIETSDRIRFFENGVMSVNLPFATQIVGTKASRSTHPRSLELIGRVLRLVSHHEIAVENPFLWNTKVEVVRELAATPFAQMITRSVSCSSSQYANSTYQPHCGVCVQCLQRRISILGADVGHLDESAGYAVDFLTSARENGRQRAMALGSIRLALDCATISDSDFFGQFADQLSSILQGYPVSERDDVIKKVADLYRRHGTDVRKLLSEATQPQALAVLDRTLPPSSLLALVLATSLSATPVATSEPQPTELLEPANERAALVDDSDKIFIAVDEKRGRILVSDRLELGGPVVFGIMKLLIQNSLTDRGGGRAPKNHRGMLAKEIADALSLTDENAVRSAIRRARAELDEAERQLYGVDANSDAIIESVPGKGYRINPNVNVVTLDEYRNR